MWVFFCWVKPITNDYKSNVLSLIIIVTWINIHQGHYHDDHHGHHDRHGHHDHHGHLGLHHHHRHHQPLQSCPTSWSLSAACLSTDRPHTIVPLQTRVVGARHDDDHHDDHHEDDYHDDQLLCTLLYCKLFSWVKIYFKIITNIRVNVRTSWESWDVPSYENFCISNFEWILGWVKSTTDSVVAHG